MEKYKNWQEQETPLRKYLIFLAIGLLIFPIAIPTILVFLMPKLDNLLGLGSFYFGTVNIIIGILMIVPGGIFAIWTIIVQIKFASGTPFPMLPTKKLLTIGAFKYCRNPMTLGTILAYGGICIMIGSFAALFLLVLISTLLLINLKVTEEKELAYRFGQEYVEYKNNTPFILPIRIGKVKSKK